MILLEYCWLSRAVAAWGPEGCRRKRQGEVEQDIAGLHRAGRHRTLAGWGIGRFRDEEGAEVVGTKRSCTGSSNRTSQSCYIPTCDGRDLESRTQLGHMADKRSRGGQTEDRHRVEDYMRTGVVDDTGRDYRARGQAPQAAGIDVDSHSARHVVYLS